MLKGLHLPLENVSRNEIPIILEMNPKSISGTKLFANEYSRFEYVIYDIL